MYSINSTNDFKELPHDVWEIYAYGITIDNNSFRNITKLHTITLDTCDIIGGEIFKHNNELYKIMIITNTNIDVKQLGYNSNVSCIDIDGDGELIGNIIEYFPNLKTLNNFNSRQVIDKNNIIYNQHKEL